MNFRERIYHFLQGRYGNDELNRFLLALIIISVIIRMFSNMYFLEIVYLLLTVIVLFRCLSKNIISRAAENAKFLSLTEPIRIWLGNISGKSSCKIYMCPECRQKLRVPKGKGRIQITCRKCGKTFIKRS